MYYAHTYFCVGPLPAKLDRNTPRHEAKEPPWCGWGHVFFFKFEKHRLIFDAASFYTATVSHRSAEVHMSHGKAVEIDEPMQERLIKSIIKQWHFWAQLGHQKDYAVAARVLKELGCEDIPQVEVRNIHNTDADAEPRKPKGKEAEQDHSKLKPIKASSKRGKVAKFFMAQARSLPEAEAALGMNRNNILSHLHCIRRDHGIGYTLENNSAVLAIPEGFKLFGDEG